VNSVKDAALQPVEAEGNVQRTQFRRRKYLLFYLRQGGRLGPLLVALVCLVFLFEALKLSFGGLGNPGPGLWPTGIIVITLGISFLATALVRESPKLFRFKGAVRSGTYIALLLLFWPFYELLGFIPSASILCVVLFRYVGREKWVTSVITAVISSVAVYLIFGVLLEMRITPIVGF
jgi:putative tricarboxylic transport membrane protein